MISEDKHVRKTNGLHGADVVFVYVATDGKRRLFAKRRTVYVSGKHI